jgi:hypothetical protein
VKGISRTYSEANGDFIRPFSTVEYMREKPTASAGRIVSCKWEVVVPQVFSLSVQEYLPSCLVLAISSSGASYLISLPQPAYLRLTRLPWSASGSGSFDFLGALGGMISCSNFFMNQTNHSVS